MGSKISALSAIAFCILIIFTPSGCAPSPLDDVLLDTEKTDGADLTDLPFAGQPLVGGPAVDPSVEDPNSHLAVPASLDGIQANPPGGVAPVLIQFAPKRGGSTGTLTYQWDFGDGSSSSLENPTHLYDQLGIFEVTLVASDGNGPIGDKRISVPIIPVHEIIHGQPDATLTVDFTVDTVEVPDWLDEAQYQWDFGDGTVASGRSVSHSFRQIGTYHVVLSALIAGATVGCDSRDVNIPAPATAIAPVANAGPDQDVTDEDENGTERIVLNGLESYDPDGAIKRYRWSWNDMVIYNGANAWAAVDMPVGVHEVQLKVTDNSRQSATDTVAITVRSGANLAPVANAGPDQSVVDLDDDGFAEVQFDGSASTDADNLITHYRWTAGGQVLSEGAGAVQSASIAVGVYSVSLEVTDEQGATDSDSFELSILTPTSSELFAEAYDGYSAGAQPADWFSTGANNSLAESPGLYRTVNVGGSMAFGTNNDAYNTHSHYRGNGASQWTNYAVTGRMRVDQSSGGIGVTVFSQYPDADKYYRLRSYWGNPFELSSHGTHVIGDTLSSVSAQPGVWYLFRIEAEDAGDRTNIRASVWAEGDAEPSVWQIEAEDASADRMSGGTVGVWAMDAGEKAVDDLVVTSIETGVILNADAGPDQYLSDADNNGHEMVQFDASGSNTNRAISTYRWLEGGTVIATSNNPTTSVDLPVGAHDITLQVFDTDGNSDDDFLMVTISPPPPEGCETSGPVWQNVTIPAISGVATIEFDAVANGNNIDGLTCFSQGPSNAYSNTAVALRFNASGNIDARNGAIYDADTAVGYSAGQQFHVRIVIDVTSHRYSVYVTPESSAEILLAANFAFRSGTEGVSMLDNCATNASIGDHDTCDMLLVSGGNQPPIADAGFARTVSDADDNGSESVNLDGSNSSDPDGSIVNYRWTEGAGVLADGANSSPAVTLAVGTHNITLTVTDNGGATDTDTVLITVGTSSGTVMMSSVSQYGITWTFDQAYPVGQFVTGDYYVVGPATVVSVSPGPSGGNNGSMINPAPGTAQAYDSGWQYYDASLAVNYPLTLQPNQSLVSTVSNSGPGPFRDLMNIDVSVSFAFLKSASVLTCLASPVSNTTFRPPLAGNAKPLYDAANLRTDLLPALTPTGGNLTVAGGGDPITQYKRYFERPWLLHQWDWLGRMIHPTDNMPNYHREQYAVQGDAALLLLCDYPNREELLIPYVQVGIDSYYVSLTGQGENTLHKWNVIFAGLMLDDVAMQNTSAGYRTDFMTYYAGTGSSPFGNANRPTGWTGATALWRQRSGDLEHEHLDPPDWGVVPSDGGIKREAYRRSNSYVWPGGVLAARIMSAQNHWNHPALFDYMDRWMNEYDVDNMAYLQQLWNYQLWIPGRSCNSSFVKNMWNQYRSQY
jgi:hypothetical protein